MAHDPQPSPPTSDLLLVGSQAVTTVDPASSTSPTPAQQEPVTDVERINMLRRLTELGLSGKDKSSHLSARETELVDMVLRLSSHIPPDSSQLILQATTISNLQVHQDYLLQQVEEERSRWESEKDGWARMAEALIAQHKAGGSPVKDEELERQCAAFESDNRSLREKLAETQSRLTSLESELTKLRPILLMQPLTLSSSHVHNSNADLSRQKTPRMRKKKEKIQEKERGKDPPTPNPFLVLPISDVHDTDEEIDELADDPTNTPAITKTNSTTHSRRSPRKPISTVKTNTGKSAALLSDARSEHLLLAARKIGRERAGIVAGLTSSEAKERERERDRKKEEMATPRPLNLNASTNFTSPKTPRRGSVPMPIPLPVSVPLPIPTSVPAPLTCPAPPFTHAPQNPGFVFLNSPLAYAGSTVHPPYLVPYPPMQAQTPTRGREVKATPPTPLDSLLSAVKSVIDEEESAGAGSSSEARDGLRAKGGEGVRSKIERAKRASVVDPESPVSQKRRKIAGKSTPNASVATIRGQKTQTVVESPSSGLGRMKSALDVLADQAAVFSSKTVEPQGVDKKKRVSVDSGRSAVKGAQEKKIGGKGNGGKGKGKGTEDGDGDEGPDDIPTTSTCLSPLSPREELYQFSRKWKNGPHSLRPVTRWGDEVNSSLVAKGVGAESIVVRNQEEKAEGGVDQGKDTSLYIHLSPPTTPPPLPPPLLALPTPDTNADSDVPSYDTDLGITRPRGKVEGRQRRRSNEPLSPIMLSRSRSEDRRTSPRSLVFTGPEKPEIPRRASSIPLRSTSPSSSQRHRRTDCNSPKMKGGDVAIEEEQDDDPTEAVDTVLELGALRGNDCGGETGSGGSGENRDLERVGGQGMQMVMPGKRPRSPYVKWSKDEDDLLSQAVAKYGQKWDLVQKALPSRGYHQVRQRWLRKLGVFNSKPDLSSLQTGILAGSVSVRTGTGTSTGGSESEGTNVDPPPNPKLGLAPLSSEWAF